MKWTNIMLVALALLPMAGCGGHSIDTEALGNLIGGKAGHMVKAGGHFAKAETLSEKDEDNLGQSVGVVLTNTYPVLHDDAATRYITLVGYTVASTSPHPDMRYVFGILDTPEVNAFSGPHGYIFITRGALENIRDEAELAGVLGHEMSHVMLHHGLEQLKAAELQAAASEAVKSSPIAKFSADADKTVDAITKTGYTQQQEFAADASSVTLIARAGYNPVSYLNFLRRLAQLQNSGGGAMSTHPGGAQRVQRVAAQLNSMSQTGATLADRFRSNCGSL